MEGTEAGLRLVRARKSALVMLMMSAGDLMVGCSKPLG